jgi:transposase
MRPWLADDAPTRHLRYLVEQRERLVDQRTALVNQLQAALKLYFPQAVDWLADLTKPTAWDFLRRWPTLAQAQTAQKKTLLNFFYAHHVRRGDQIGELHTQIAAATALHDDEPIIASTVLLVAALCRQLRTLAPAIRAHDRQIATLYAAHPDRTIYQSLPGAGPVLEPRLLAAMGSQRERFADARDLQSLSGIAPVTVRSGKSVVVQFRWAAPVFLRQSFHEWAALTRFWSAWARAFYDEKIARGFAHHAAVRALAYKWQRILYRCWQERQPYDEAHYLAALRRHGSWLAARVDQARAADQPSEQPA